MRALLFLILFVATAVVTVAVYTRYQAGSIGRITSWFRSPFHNADVGGLSGSLHIIGWAVDIVPDPDQGTATMVEVATAASTVGFPVVVNEGNHVHVSWFRA